MSIFQNFPSIILIVLVVLSGAFIVYMRYEATRLKVEHVNPFGADADDGSAVNLRIVHITDIHLKTLKIPLYAISDCINKSHPDVVLLTGDYIDKSSEIPGFLKWIDELIKTVTEQNPKFFLCFGNHDQRAFRRDMFAFGRLTAGLDELGVTVLENMTATLFKNGKKYSFIGYRDISYYKYKSRKYGEEFTNPKRLYARKTHDGEQTNPRRLSIGSLSDGSLSRDSLSNGLLSDGTNSEDCTRIGMSHNPDMALHIKEGVVDLLLTGHFHGGQIRLPFKLEYRLLRREQLCKRGITKGLHRVNGNLLYISRGVGCVLFPLRFMSIPEITVFNLP